MKKAFYIRTKRAGRRVKCVRYQRPLPCDTGRARAAKMRHTKAAQRFINCKNTTEKLELLLFANFDSPLACFVTLTYDGSHLPRSKAAAKANMAKVNERMRCDKRKRGEPFPYVYTTEGAAQVSTESIDVGADAWEVCPWEVKERWEELGEKPTEWANGEARLHHHAIMLLSDSDFDALRAAWPHGAVYISRIKVDDISSFERLASYITKDSRAEKTKTGERAYTPSEGLVQPEVSGRWVEEYEDIVPPTGAVLISDTRDETQYSSYHQCSFILPKEAKLPEEYQSPYKSRKRNK